MSVTYFSSAVTTWSARRLATAPAERVDVLQLALLVATGRPFKRIQIHRIGNAKILERAQELSVNGFRQTDLAAMRLWKYGRMFLPSIRSGVAVKPSRMRGW